MKNIPLLVATIVGTFAIIFGVAFFFSRSSTPQVADASQVAAGARHVFTTQANTATDSAEVATDSAEEAVEPDAQVVQVVEFSDFQCPACRAALPIKDELMRQYPGQVEFIYRHYPLIQIHPNAMLAAQAAEAAGTYDQFWPMHDLLFENQTEWSVLSNQEAREAFIGFAEELNIPRDEFTARLDDAQIRDNIQTDINAGDQFNISGTPTFYVNGQKVTAPDVIPTVDQLLQ